MSRTRAGAKPRLAPKAKGAARRRTAQRAAGAERIEASDRLDLEARVPAEQLRFIEEADAEEESDDEEAESVDAEEADQWTDAEYGGDLDDEAEPGAFSAENVVDALAGETGDDGRRLRPEASINICKFSSGLMALPAPEEPPYEPRLRLLKAVGDFLIDKYGDSLCSPSLRDLEVATTLKPSSNSDLRRWLGQEVTESSVSRLLNGKFIRLPGAGIVGLGLFFQRDERRQAPSPKSDRLSAVISEVFAEAPGLTDARAADLIFRRAQNVLRKRPSADWVSRWRKRLGIKNVYERRR